MTTELAAPAAPTVPVMASNLPRFEIVFLDMDGVLSDMVTPLLKLHNRNPEPAMIGWNPGEYDMSKALGMPESKMWAKVDESPNFWHDIQPYPHFKAMVEIAAAISASVRILSKPHRHESSYAGKFDWHRRHCPPAIRLILTGEKHFLARPGRLLIDDSDENCDAFRAAGGSAILFPQHWNSAHDRAPFGPLFYLAQELEKLAREQESLAKMKATRRPALDAMGITMENH